MGSSPNTSDRYAAVGGVCAAWAQLEMILLLILATLFDMDEDTAAAAFGNLDMGQRLTKCVIAARHFNAPKQIVRQLESLRTEVRDKTAERRNQAVHAVRLKSDDSQSSKLLMHRWPKERRERDVAVEEWNELYSLILGHAGDAAAVLADLVEWVGGGHRAKDSRDNL